MAKGQIPKEYPYGGLPKNVPYIDPVIPQSNVSNPQPRIGENSTPVAGQPPWQAGSPYTGAPPEQSTGCPVSGRVPVDRIVNP